MKANVVVRYVNTNTRIYFCLAWKLFARARDHSKFTTHEPRNLPTLRENSLSDKPTDEKRSVWFSPASLEKWSEKAFLLSLEDDIKHFKVNWLFCVSDAVPLQPREARGEKEWTGS